MLLRIDEDTSGLTGTEGDNFDETSLIRFEGGTPVDTNGLTIRHFKDPTQANTAIGVSLNLLTF